MSEKWTVTGTIVVDHILPELIEMRGSRSGVEGIQVKVSARSKIMQTREMNFRDFLDRAGTS
ncbi:MAG: hypothetical protein ABI837_18075 [Acidobacteriota bacterium]